MEGERHKLDENFCRENFGISASYFGRLQDLGDVAELHDLPPQRPTTPYRGGRWGESQGHVAEHLLLALLRCDRWTAASGTAGGGRDWWSSALRTSWVEMQVLPEDVRWSAQPQWKHTMPKDLQDSSHREEYDIFWAWEFQPKALICSC